MKEHWAFPKARVWHQHGSPRSKIRHTNLALTEQRQHVGRDTGHRHYSKREPCKADSGSCALARVLLKRPMDVHPHHNESEALVTKS